MRSGRENHAVSVNQLGVGHCSFFPQCRNEATIKFGVRLNLVQEVLRQFSQLHQIRCLRLDLVDPCHSGARKILLKVSTCSQTSEMLRLRSNQQLLC
jgi:hypothetical protein